MGVWQASRVCHFNNSGELASTLRWMACAIDAMILLGGFQDEYKAL